MITVAKSAGFCFGVKRAVDMVYKEAEKNVIPNFRTQMPSSTGLLSEFGITIFSV